MAPKSNHVTYNPSTGALSTYTSQYQRVDPNKLFAQAIQGIDRPLSAYVDDIAAMKNPRAPQEIFGGRKDAWSGPGSAPSRPQVSAGLDYSDPRVLAKIVRASDEMEIAHSLVNPDNIMKSQDVMAGRKVEDLSPELQKFYQQIRGMEDKAKVDQEYEEHHQGFWGRTFDVLSRFNYAVANAYKGRVEAEKDNGGITFWERMSMLPGPVFFTSPHNYSEGFKDMWAGFSGKEKTYFSSVLEEAGMDPGWGRTLLGMGLDIATDPTTYIGVGMVKGAGKGVATGVRAATGTEKVLDESALSKKILEKLWDEHDGLSYTNKDGVIFDDREAFVNMPVRIGVAPTNSDKVFSRGATKRYETAARGVHISDSQVFIDDIAVQVRNSVFRTSMDRLTELRKSEKYTEEQLKGTKTTKSTVMLATVDDYEDFSKHMHEIHSANGKAMAIKGQINKAATEAEKDGLRASHAAAEQKVIELKAAAEKRFGIKDITQMVQRPEFISWAYAHPEYKAATRAAKEAQDAYKNVNRSVKATTRAKKDAYDLMISTREAQHKLFSDLSDAAFNAINNPVVGEAAKAAPKAGTKAAKATATAAHKMRPSDAKWGQTQADYLKGEIAKIRGHLNKGTLPAGVKSKEDLRKIADDMIAEHNLTLDEIEKGTYSASEHSARISERGHAHMGSQVSTEAVHEVPKSTPASEVLAKVEADKPLHAKAVASAEKNVKQTEDAAQTVQRIHDVIERAVGTGGPREVARVTIRVLEKGIKDLPEGGRKAKLSRELADIRGRLVRADEAAKKIGKPIASRRLRTENQNLAAMIEKVAGAKHGVPLTNEGKLWSVRMAKDRLEDIKRQSDIGSNVAAKPYISDTEKAAQILSGVTKGARKVPEADSRIAEAAAERPGKVTRDIQAEAQQEALKTAGEVPSVKPGEIGEAARPRAVDNVEEAMPKVDASVDTPAAEVLDRMSGLPKETRDLDVLQIDDIFEPLSDAELHAAIRTNKRIDQEVLEEATKEANAVVDDLAGTLQDALLGPEGPKFRRYLELRMNIPLTKFQGARGLVIMKARMPEVVSEALHKFAQRPVVSQAVKGFDAVFRTSGTDSFFNDLHLNYSGSADTRIKYMAARLRGTFKGTKPEQRANAFRSLMNNVTLEGKDGEIQKAISQQLDEITQVFSNNLDSLTPAAKVEELNSWIPYSKFRLQKPNISADLANQQIWIRHAIAAFDGDPAELLWYLNVAKEKVTATLATKAVAKEIFGVSKASLRKSGSESRILTGDAKTSWRPVDGMGSDIVFPPDIANDLDKMMSVMKGQQNTAQLIRYFDRVQGMWKRTITVNNPGYHMRNQFSDWFVAYLAGVSGASGIKAYAQSGRVLKSWGKIVNDQEGMMYKALTSADPLKTYRSEAHVGKTTEVLFKKNGKDFTIGDAIVLYHQHGLASGFVSTEFDRAFTKGDMRPSAVGRKAGQVNQGILKASEQREDWARMAHFLHALRHSDARDFEAAAEEAAQSVRKYHFDYSDFTQSEKQFLIRAIPFYKWTRKAIPLMVESMFAQPGKVMMVPRAMSAMSQSAGFGPTDRGLVPESDDIIPEWIRSSGAFPMFKHGGNTVFGSPALPFSDITKTVGGGWKQLASMFSPALQIPTELAFKQELSGKKLENAGDYRDYAIGQTPQTGFVNQLIKDRQSDTGTKGNIFTDPRVLSFLSGIMLRENTDKEMTNELWRRRSFVIDYKKQHPQATEKEIKAAALKAAGGFGN